ncbi:MAG: M23 family metallopeptidase [Fibrobacterota bacterium]
MTLVLFVVLFLLALAWIYLLPRMKEMQSSYEFRKEILHRRVEDVRQAVDSARQLQKGTADRLTGLRRKSSALSKKQLSARRDSLQKDRFLHDSLLDLTFLHLYTDSLLQEYTRLAERIDSGENIFDDIPVIIPLPSGERFYRTRSFGMYQGVFEEREKRHTGVDYSAPVGTPVIAPAHGRVLRAGEHRFWGKYVEISHSHGVTTFYAHLDSYSVRARRNVSKGDTIGTVGETGYSEGPHVHYEIRLDGTPRNPEPFLVHHDS